MVRCQSQKERKKSVPDEEEERKLTINRKNSKLYL